MGLEEGLRETAAKGGGEIRIGWPKEQGFQERESWHLHGGEGNEPFLLLRLEEHQPPVQLVKGDGEAFAESFHGRQVQEMLGQDM